MILRAIISSLLLFMISCSSSNKVIKKTVTQTYSNLVFNPTLVTKQSVNKTEITITPIDAKKLNEETFDAAFRDGNYEKEFVSVIEKWETRLKSASKQDKILLQGYINAFAYLTKIEKEGKIPSNLAYLLRRRIANEDAGKGGVGKDGTEITSLLDIDDFPDDYNPYKVNENYFSVFKMTFDNKGSEIEKINLKEFQFVSNEEQLYPLASEYFEKNLINRSETMKNAYRMNMPNELVLTPGQRVTKYLAVPAINPDNNKLQVQFIRDKKVVNFDFSTTKNEKSKSYNLESYEFGYGKDGDPTISNFFVISYKNGNSYALKDNKIFVSDEKKSSLVSVYAIGISQYNSDTFFGSAVDFTFSSVKKNKKKIDFDRVKKEKKK